MKTISIEDLVEELSRLKAENAALKAANKDSLSRLSETEKMLALSEEIRREALMELKKLNERIFNALIEQYVTKQDRIISSRDLADRTSESDARDEAEEALADLGRRAGTERKAVGAPENRRTGTRIKDDDKRGLDPRALDDIPVHETIVDDEKAFMEMAARAGKKPVMIGYEESFFLEMTPARFERVIYRRKKYAVPGRPELGVAVAPMPPRLLPKTAAGEGFLAGYMSDKFYRRVSYAMEAKMMEAAGIPVDRKALSRWQIMVTDQLEPLSSLILDELRSGKNIQIDETAVSVDGCEHKKPYVWIATSVNCPHPARYYRLGPGRGLDALDDLLGGCFSGYMQSDGYAAYKSYAASHQDVVQVSCLAHIRRKFVVATNALGGQNSTANSAIGLCDDIFRIERNLRKLHREGRIDEAGFLDERKRSVTPVIGRIEDLAKGKPVNTRGAVIESPAYDSAASYCLDMLPSLRNYLDCFSLSPSNNRSEQGAKSIKRGLDSWYKFGSEKGAESGCILFTLLETADLNGLYPPAYLDYVFHKAAALLSLPPDERDWKPLLPWNIDKSELAIKPFKP